MTDTKNPKTPPPATTPAMDENEALELLNQTKGAEKARAERQQKLYDSLTPDGMTVLGAALIEKFVVVDPTPYWLFLSVLWAMQNQRADDALSKTLDEMSREAAAMAAALPAADIPELGKKAREIVKTLPGMQPIEFYEIQQLEPDAPDPTADPKGNESVVAVLDPNETVTSDWDKSQFRNSTQTRVAIWKREVKETKAGE